MRWVQDDAQQLAAAAQLPEYRDEWRSLTSAIPSEGPALAGALDFNCDSDSSHPGAG